MIQIQIPIHAKIDFLTVMESIPVLESIAKWIRFRFQFQFQKKTGIVAPLFTTFSDFTNTPLFVPQALGLRGLDPSTPRTISHNQAWESQSEV